MKKLLLLVLLFLIGCSQQPVEDSTLIEKDGLMYLLDSDKSFSGEVFINYSSGEIEYQGIYEEGRLISESFLNKNGTQKEPLNKSFLFKKKIDYVHESLGYQTKTVYNTKEFNQPYNGPYFELDENGNLDQEGFMKNGILYGPHKKYFSDGTLFLEEIYGPYKRLYETKITDHRHTHGPLSFLKFYREYNGDGQIEEEWDVETGLTLKNFYWDEFHDELLYSQDVFENDILIKKRDYYKNGQLRGEGDVKNGELDGPFKIYHENGQLKHEGTHYNGYISGPFKIYHENGQLKQEGTYQFDELHGTILSFNENGKLYNERVYDMGIIINDKFYNEDGTEKSSIKSNLLYEKNGLYYHKSTEKLYSGYFNNKYNKFTLREGILDGLYKIYHENGQLKHEGTYKDDKVDGLVKFYYENGQLKEEGTYKDGKLDGTYKWYHKNGQLKSERTYKDDEVINYKEY